MELSECTCVDAAIGMAVPLVFRTVRAPHGGSSSSCSVCSLGRHWRDVLVDLGAIGLHSLQDGRLSITSISKAQVARSAEAEFLTTDRSRWWLLHDDEQLIAVDLSLGDDEATSGLRGVRLTTMQRESAWYGSCTGSRVEQLAAPTHFFINGLFSSVVDGVGVEFGVRIEPKDRHEHHSVCDRDEELTRSAQCPLICLPPSAKHAARTISFVVSHFHLRAVVVSWHGEAIDRVDVLSSSQYARMQAANHDGHRQAVLHDNEDMLVLSEDEEIVRVGISYSRQDLNEDPHVIGVTITTTRTLVGRWLGPVALSNDLGIVKLYSSQLFSQDDSRPVKVSGFRGSYNENHDRIMQLEPVYHYLPSA